MTRDCFSKKEKEKSIYNFNSSTLPLGLHSNSCTVLDREEYEHFEGSLRELKSIAQKMQIRLNPTENGWNIIYIKLWGTNCPIATLG
jgi:hypothetical protein